MLWALYVEVTIFTSINVMFVRSLAEPIEYIPRSKGLGLGAERRPPPGGVGPGKRRKPGDETSNKVFQKSLMSSFP